MRLRPDRFEMTEGEVNKMRVSLGPVTGANSVSDIDFANSALTFVSPTINGTDATVFVSGGSAGTDYVVTITADLSSGETKVGAVLLKWKAPGFDDIAGVR